MGCANALHDRYFRSGLPNWEHNTYSAYVHAHIQNQNIQDLGGPRRCVESCVLTLPNSANRFFIERVDYYTQFKRVARTDTLKKFELLSIRHTEKEPVPLLPLTTDYSTSPLRGYVDAPDESEAASSLMGPGPWAVQHELQLPKSCARMHFTNKHKRSNIGITHTLKIIFRVERGDDLFVDAKTGRRKHFDIVVQTPIHILSVHTLNH